MRERIIFLMSSVLTVFLLLGIFFCDCKNMPVNVRMLPDSIAIASLILYPFLVAASIIKTIIQYGKAFGTESRSSALAVSTAQFFGFIFSLLSLLVLLRYLSFRFCD